MSPSKFMLPSPRPRCQLHRVSIAMLDAALLRRVTPRAHSRVETERCVLGCVTVAPMPVHNGPASPLVCG